VSDIEVRRARPEDLGVAAAVLSQAFSTDEVSVAALARPRDPRRALRTVFTSLLRHHYLPRGVVDLALSDGEVVGVAAWSGPGAVAFTPRETVWVLADLVPRLGWRMAPATLYDWRTERVHPRERHWYLYSMGAARPGNGVGGALLDHALARAGATPSYCEASTPDSARLYHRKGFRRIGEAPTPSGCPPQPQMWHPGAQRR